MQRLSHFNFFIRGLLQLCSYLVQQLPVKYKVSIDTEVFLSAFTVQDDNGERVRATSWSGAPDGSAYDSNIEVPDANDLGTDESGGGSQGLIASAGIGQVGIHTGQLNSIVIRRILALKWIDQQEKCYLFLPILPEDTPNWEQMRRQIILGPHGVRYIKPAKKSNQDDGSKPKPSKLRFLIRNIINTDNKYQRAKM
jgi:hypothetical protein